MTTKMRWGIGSVLMAGLFYVGTSIVAAVFLAESAVHPFHGRASGPIPQFATATLIPEPMQSVAIQSSDGATLRAWYIRPSAANGASVVLLHGMADTRVGMVGYARMFLRQGYSVLLPDSRAHGASGGSIATYGVLERDDVRRWVQWLSSRTPGCDYLLGESMGAAIAIQASAITPGLCAVAAEAPFATFREIANDRIAQSTHLGLWFSQTLAVPTREFALLYVDARFHVDLADANPLRSLRRSRVPTLLICGTADTNIPMRHSLELYRAAASHTSLWTVQGAQHTGAAARDPAEFQQRVISWFRTHTHSFNSEIR